MADALPDRLSTNPDSPYYDETLLAKGVGIRFNGVEKTNVDEYCVSEGWVRVTAGNAKDRFGNPMTIKLKGKVEPYLQSASKAQPIRASVYRTRARPSPHGRRGCPAKQGGEGTLHDFRPSHGHPVR